MKIPLTNRDPQTSRRKARAQGLVEFALILPVLLLTIFVIVELARVLHAWLAVENGARFGVRYAVTGEFDDAQCWVLYPATGCVTESQEDGARIPSIKEAAQVGAVAILKNDAVTTVGDPGYFKVTVCSSKETVAYLPSDPDTPTAADCVPVEDGGGPGDRVIVTIDFDHPLITPMLSTVWPDLHLSAKREGIVEQFRTARVVGLPATASGPTPTPSNTPTPSDTPTPPATATPSNTPTPTNTPTATPLPDCGLLNLKKMEIKNGNEIKFRVENKNNAAAKLISTILEWEPDKNGSAKIDYFKFAKIKYWGGDSDNAIIGPISSNVVIVGNKNENWSSKVKNPPPLGIWGSFKVTLNFNFPGWGTCPAKAISMVEDEPIAPTATPVPPTITPGPSPTPAPTNTPKPPKATKVPTNTPDPSWTDTPEPTDTPVPTNTPPGGPTSTPNGWGDG